MVQKELWKLSQWFGKGFWNGMMEVEKMEWYKKGFQSWSVFLISKYWLPLLFEEIIGAFLSLFFNTFSSSFSLSLFYAPSLEDLGVFMILEGKITSSKTSFQMKWYGLGKCEYRRWTHIPEWSYAFQYG
jgi:hypothetical protein